MKILLLFLIYILVSFACKAGIHLGPEQAFPNIEAAVNAKNVNPGDTVFLHAGSYDGYQYIQSLKGNSDKWIVITKYKDDEIEIAGGWQFVSCEFIKFLNLDFKANSKYPGRLINVDNGGSCETQSKYIVFDSCHFSGVTDANAITAFKFGGVDNFEITNCIFKDIPACDAFDFNVCHKGLISGNTIENCLSGGHIKGGASDITMECNLFLNASASNLVAFELGGDTGAQFYCPEDNFEVKDLKFFSNLIIGGDRGLALSSAVDCKVINNTFYNCTGMTFRFLTTSSLYPELHGNIVENNIFAFGSNAYMNGSDQIANAATVRNNIYYSIVKSDFSGPYWDYPALNEIKELNPKIFGSTTLMFVDGSANDLHLVKGSPAIGTGLPEAEPEKDFYGNNFQENRAIGAIEFEGMTDGIILPDCSGVTIFYDSFSNKLEVSRSGNTKIGYIDLFDILGRQVYSKKINGSYAKINTASILNGTYIMVIKEEDGNPITRSILLY